MRIPASTSVHFARWDTTCRLTMRSCSRVAAFLTLGASIHHPDTYEARVHPARARWQSAEGAFRHWETCGPSSAGRREVDDAHAVGGIEAKQLGRGIQVHLDLGE